MTIATLGTQLRMLYLIGYTQFVVNRFRRFLKDKYPNRDLDSLRKRHIRAYLAMLSRTTSSTRTHLCVIKSFCGHLCKLGVIRADPSSGFKLPRQNACRTERNLSVAAVRALFDVASHRLDKSTYHALEIFVYGGLRLTACCSLRRADIHRVEQNSSSSAPSSKQHLYYIRVRRGKGGKSRKV